MRYILIDPERSRFGFSFAWSCLEDEAERSLELF